MDIEGIALDRVSDEFAEIGCFCFTLAGPDNAFRVLSRVSSREFVAQRGAVGHLMAAAARLRSADRAITVASIAEVLGETAAVAGAAPKNLLSEIGGLQALARLAKRFPVEDGHIKFDIAGEAVLADAETLAASVRERANRRLILQRIKKIQKSLEDPEGRMTSAAACRELTVTSLEASKGVERAARSDSESYSEFRAELERMLEPDARVVPTCYLGYNKLLGGTRGGDFVLINAADKQGKSTNALELANHDARHGIPTVYVPLEMGVGLLRKRRILINSERMITADELITNPTDRGRRFALQVWDEIYRDPFYILNKFRSKEDLIPALEMMIREFGVRGITIDYWQRMQGRSKSKEDMLTEASMELADLVTRYEGDGVFVRLVSQMNDEGAQIAKTLGIPSNDHTYGSRQANKDCTVGTALQFEPEIFKCACPEPQVREIPVVNLRFTKTITVPKWDKRPSNGICPDCRREGRDPVIYRINPKRRGGWFIDRSRNSEPGTFIPMLFDGTYMRMEEMGGDASDYIPVDNDSPDEDDLAGLFD